jgi:hypothetical protein
MQIMEILSFIGSVLACLTMINIIPFRRTIFDVGHFLIPRIESTALPEYILIFKALPVLFYNTDKIMEILAFSSIFLWTRAVLTGITILPSLRNEELIHLKGITGGHNDYLPFSGHTAFSVLFSTFLTDYFGYIVYMSDIYIIYILIAMRRHYTIELIMSVLYILFLRYH